MDPYSITTPIYYVNDRPHIGHCYTTTVADVAARFARMIRGGAADVFFLTGTDEHGQKVEKSAAARGLTPIALADENAAHFRAAMKLIGASNDDFIRTTEARHTRQVQSAIARLLESGDVYLGTFEGWYDEGQEEYVTENQAREKDFKAFNGQPLKKATEQNYYFRLSKWQGALEALFRDNPEFVRPAARMNEVLGRLREGLQDVPVSRTNFTWGIPVPGAPGHVTYVWIDALLNYATAVGAVDAKVAAETGVPAGRARFWAASWHVIGKEILWFHAVIWPALLMALKLPLPGAIYAHSFWIAEGKKMSKTLGNFIDLAALEAYIGRFGLDALRWYLLTQGPLRETDADFSYAKFVEVYNAELANGLGNCASRVGNMIDKYFGGKVPDPQGIVAWYQPGFGNAVKEKTGLVPLRAEELPVASEGGVIEFDFQDLCKRAVDGAIASVGKFDIADALQQGTHLIRQVDAFINVTAPFKLAKETSDPKKQELLAAILYNCAEAVRVASVLMAPALIERVPALWRTWNCTPREGATLREACEFGGPCGLKPGQSVTKGEVLFMRADAAEKAPA